MKKPLCLAFLLIFSLCPGLGGSLFAQETEAGAGAGAGSGPEAPPRGEMPAELVRGFRDITLGMTMDETKEALKADPWFLFRGDPDVSLLAVPNETLIDCAGTGYISRALFQFDQDRLFTITIVVNNRRSDYYSLFTTLTAKYGEFDSLSPEMVIWDDGATRMTLERPLTVKYIDREVLDRKREESRTGRDLLEESHRAFLEEF